MTVGKKLTELSMLSLVIVVSASIVDHFVFLNRARRPEFQTRKLC